MELFFKEKQSSNKVRSLFSFGVLLNIFSENNKNQNSQNQRQTKGCSSLIDKLIQLINCHLDRLSRIIAKYKPIIEYNRRQVNSLKDGAKGIDKNQAAEAFTIKPEYTLNAALEKITFFTSI